MHRWSLIGSLLVSMLAIVVFLPEQTSAGCTCDAWCRERGHRDGICGDGHTCICTGMDRSKCTCDAWCRGAGYRGGICGDGHTCICDSRRGRRSIEIPVDIIDQNVDADLGNAAANY